MMTTRKAALTQISFLALTTGLALGTAPASAQNNGSFQADGVVVEGSAQIFRDPDFTDIIVETPSVVIDWTPDDTGTGGDLLFQPFGTIATFQDDGIVTDFAVLNRILPTDLSRRIVFDGTVVSEIQGQVGGTVFFYSPGGILVGNSAVFDVGNLGLTTADPLVDGNGDFIVNNQVTFQQSDPNASITIDPTAGIFADAPGSYVAVFAPQIINHGLISTGGQAALVGAEAGTITFSPDGLFDIQVSIGSEFGQPIENSGLIGGNATADGAGRVYMVAISKNSAATIAITGGSSLGFDVANSAFMDGDTVVLSAGFNVTAGEIDAVQASDGFLQLDAGDTGFGPGITFTSNVAGKASGDANLFVRDTLEFQGDAAFSGSQLFATVDTDMGAGSVGNLIVGGDLSLLADYTRPGIDVGIAQLQMFNGTSANIAGNLRVGSIASADGDGNSVVAASLGEVLVNGTGSVLNVGGDLIAESSAGLDGLGTGLIAESSVAQVIADNNGSITVGAVTRIKSTGIAGLAADAQAGPAALFAVAGGQFTTNELNIASFAMGGDGDGLGLQAGQAFTGSAGLTVDGLGSAVTVQSANSTGVPGTNDLSFASSEAIGGTGIDGNGGNANAGDINILVENGGVITLPDDSLNPLKLVTRAIGGDTSEDDGRGGDAITASSQIRILDGVQDLGRISVLSEASGGSALPDAERTSGGNADAGSFFLEFDNTTATIALEQIELKAFGGNGSSVGAAFGGAGSASNVDVQMRDSQVDILSGLDIALQGIGGTSQEVGGFGTTSSVSIISDRSVVNVAGDLVVFLESVGGDSLGDQAFDPGFAYNEQGGFASSASASLAINSSQFTVAGEVDLLSQATGGDAFVNQGGGANTGGAFIDLFQDPQIPGAPASVLSANDVILETTAFGGSIISVSNPDSFGAGGNTSAGSASISFNGGANTIDAPVELSSAAFGGNAGQLNGVGGEGSTSVVRISNFSADTSSITGDVTAFIDSVAGDAVSDFGGNAFSGGFEVETFGGTLLLGGALSFTGLSQSGDGASGGSATGVVQRITANNSAVDILGATTTTIDVLGGDATIGQGGQASSGAIQFQAQNSGSINLAGNVSVSLTILGGNSVNGLGANADGSFSEIFAFDGSTITLGQNLSVNSVITAGNSTNGTGGNASGSGNTITADNADVSILGDATFATQVTGGAGFAGGQASGASVNLNTFNGNVQLGGAVDFSSLAQGGDANIGVGGEALGGFVGIFSGNASTVDLGGDVALASIARAGNSSDGDGGFAGGSGASIATSGGALTIGGNANVTATSEGGSGVNGGNAEGGNTTIDAFQSSSFAIAGDATLISTTSGGAGSSGIGGSAQFGSLAVSFSGSTVDIDGNLIATAIASGGDGAAGGFANSPFANPFLSDSTVKILGDFVVETLAFGGLSSGAGQAGGNALNEALGMNIENASVSVGGNVSLISSAAGGDALDGAGGDGTTNRRDINISGGSTLGALELRFEGVATGGDALGMGAHSGGNAIADHARLNYAFDGASNVASINADVLFSTNASGGNAAAAGGGGGNAEARNGEIYNFTTGTIQVSGDTNFDFNATGGNAPQGPGGSAIIGAVQVLSFEGSSLLVDGGMNINAVGTGGDGQTGGDVTGGLQQVVARGTIVIDGIVASDEVLTGGNALANIMPGTGGNATGGSVSIIASNLDTIPTSTLTLGGIVLNSTITGGAGGAGLSGADGGTGGDGFGPGGTILGQAINGVLNVSGATTINSSVTGGVGGNGVNGGDGGRALFGFYQIGTASGGSVPGTTGGSATFSSVDVVRNHVGGAGGTASNGVGGDGGEAVGGRASILSRGAPVNVGNVTFTMNGTGGIGGAGATQGNGGDGVAGGGNLLATEAFENPGRGSSNIGSFVLNATGQGGAGATAGASEYTAFSALEIEQSDVILGSFTANIIGDNVPDYTFDDGQGNQVPVTPSPFFVSLRDGATLDFGSIAVNTPGDVELFAGDAATGVGNVFEIVAGNFVPTANDISDPAYVPGTIEAATSLELTATSGDIIAEANLVSAVDLVLNSAGSIITRDLTGSSVFLTLGAGGVLDPAAINAPGGLISVEAIDSLSAPGDVNAASLSLLSLNGDVTVTGPLTLSGDFTADAGGSITTDGVNAQNATLNAGGAITDTGGIDASGTLDAQAGSDIAITMAAASSMDLRSLMGNVSASGPIDATGTLEAQASGTVALGDVSASSIAANAGTGVAINGMWSAQQITLSAPDFTFAAQAALDAGASGSVTISSTNAFNLFLGDGADPAFQGLVLGAEDLGQISAGDLFIGSIGSGGPGFATIGDLDLSDATNVGNFTFAAAQGLDVVGALVGQSDITLQADQITVDIDAGGRINLGTIGTALTISAGSFAAGDESVLSALLDEPTPGELQALVNAPAAVPVEQGVISAGTLILNVADQAIIQNTGSEEVPAGFVVGSAEDLVIGDGNQGAGALVVLNGQILDESETATTGDDAATAFFEALSGNATVAAGSQLNACSFSSCVLGELGESTGELTSSVSASVSGATAATTSGTGSTSSTPSSSTSEGASEGGNDGESSGDGPSAGVSTTGSAEDSNVSVDEVDDGSDADEFAIEDEEAVPEDSSDESASEESEEPDEIEDAEEEAEEETTEEEDEVEGPTTGPINPPPSIINTGTLEQRGAINDPISGSGNPALLDPEVTLQGIDTDGGQ
ncbi:hypothetical protein INR77_03260 [Erythrobacter sp. SCSIO 43205]|uniref:hypothetical protein n=1 Tax=Erythrobacter sp. SCSIO 43205 TaxID=2779361 RepID=UPI001CA7C26B|nr:hypothetical protein [Erythrobacter sp. SCSIO 43205]UAB78759.1 hypothetical protein INR77_03260 [Erythrobacter sp. SCSIO 43205]